MRYDCKGLTDEQVEASRREYGTNAIPPPQVESFWEKLIGNLKDPMIVILVVALVVISILAVLGFAAWYEGVGIAFAVALATLVATASEHKNEQTFQKLQEEASQISVTVFRSGTLRKVTVDDLVVGDKVFLQSGDRICADGAILVGEIQVDQATFTGEAAPVRKVGGEADAAQRDLDSAHAVFRGTTVEDGDALMTVQCIGKNTYLGRLTQEMESDDDRAGPLRSKLGVLAQDIAKFGYIGGTLIALSYLFKAVLMDNGFSGDRIAIYLAHWQAALYDVATAVILAVIIVVVAVPEGLPMMIAIVLARNMRKLLNAKVLVRQLLGIETAGSLNILFCDKTGTITKGKLEVVNFSSLAVANGRLDIREYKHYADIPNALVSLVDLAFHKASACVIVPKDREAESRVHGGNASERVLACFALNGEDRPPCDLGNIEVLERILFNPSRKFSGCRVRQATGEELTVVKGAPEMILSRCVTFHDEEGRVQGFTPSQKENLFRKLNVLSEQGLRIIALATGGEFLTEGQLPAELSLIGFASISDELRAESPQAIQTLRRAGIHVVMLTGDKMGTARAIAREAKLLVDEDGHAWESDELAGLEDDELKKQLRGLFIVARCRPEDKKRLITVAQRAGLVVGMTGDGVNDSPALRNSDVGFGLGSGTEVSKESSHIVLLDDNIKSIVNAVHYGRAIYRTIQKFIVFQLTVNVSAITVVFLGPFLGIGLPLTMTQLLWVNLIMDTLAALAFSGEPALPKHMEEKPKDRDERIITRDMWSSILINGLFIAALSVIFLKSTWIRSLFHSETAFLTGFFGFFVFINNWNKFNARVEEMNLLAHIQENKSFLRVVGLIFAVQVILTYLGGDMFRTVPLQMNEWGLIVGLSILIIPFDLARKAFRAMILKADTLPV